MFQNIIGNKCDTLRCFQCFLPVDIPHFLIINVCVYIHCFDVVHTERKHILIIDCVHDCISVELVSESLLRCKELHIPNSSCISREYRCAGKAEQMIFLEIFHNSCVHISELASVALVKDNYNVLAEHLMPFILSYESR